MGPLLARQVVILDFFAAIFSVEITACRFRFCVFQLAAGPNIIVAKRTRVVGANGGSCPGERE